jgi:hypothetical protein
MLHVIALGHYALAHPVHTEHLVQGGRYASSPSGALRDSSP